MTKPIYATLKNGKRIGATLLPEGNAAMVHVVKGPRVGVFNLTRFEGGKLTSDTLAKLFNGDS